MNERKPIFLMAGGRSRDTARTVKSLARALRACEKKEPSVAYLGVANGDSEPFFLYVRTLLEQAGAGDVLFPRLAAPDANAHDAKAALTAVDAIFLSGGEVEDGINVLAWHGLVADLQHAYARGKVFIGLSAGSIMMGAHWVRWTDPEDDETASLFDCLAMVPTVFDTHAEDEDWKELKTALRLLGPGASGYGIPQNGMVVADSAGRLTHGQIAPLYFRNNDGRIERIE